MTRTEAEFHEIDTQRRSVRRQKNGPWIAEDADAEGELTLSIDFDNEFIGIYVPANDHAIHE